jgi:hypothetical protein
MRLSEPRPVNQVDNVEDLVSSLPNAQGIDVGNVVGSFLCRRNIKRVHRRAAQFNFFRSQAAIGSFGHTDVNVLPVSQRFQFLLQKLSNLGNRFRL